MINTENLNMNNYNIMECMIENGFEFDECVYVLNSIEDAYDEIDDPCCDNFRFDIDNIYNDIYKQCLDDGCCGFYDKEITTYCGHTVKFGFNYGH